MEILYIVLPNAVVAYALYKVIPLILTRRTLNRWDNTPKDVVILHATPRGRTLPAPSPFVLKLETYLKMAGIQYQLEWKDPFGPKGKMPWISLNGQHIGDSQLIIEFLSKKFDKNLNASYSDEELAVGTAVRIMLEEHFFWGMRNWLFLGDGRPQIVQEQVSVPKWQSWIFVKLYGHKIKGRIRAQGLGLHSDQEMQALMIKDLRTVSRIIGKKKFLLGDEPCSDDAAVFGFLAGFVLAFMRDSPYGKFIQDELHNVDGYCKRMKKKFWPDWDQLLSK